jgi:hypothetical protein
MVMTKTSQKKNLLVIMIEEAHQGLHQG